MIADPPDPVALLRRESRSLVQRLRLWTPVRYAAAVRSPPGLVPGSRADVVHHLAQSLADTTAELEGQPGRPLPRLDSDLALADQLAVASDDLVRCAPPEPVCTAATAHLLRHRAELLDDDVPAGLAVALGLDDVLAAGAAQCRSSARPGPGDS